jgi:hypothetical protein
VLIAPNCTFETESVTKLIQTCITAVLLTTGKVVHFCKPVRCIFEFVSKWHLHKTSTISIQSKLRAPNSVGHAICSTAVSCKIKHHKIFRQNKVIRFTFSTTVYNKWIDAFWFMILRCLVGAHQCLGEDCYFQLPVEIGF